MLRSNLFPTVVPWIGSLTNGTDLMIRPLSGTPLGRLVDSGLSMEAIDSTAEATAESVQQCLQECAEKVTGGEFGQHGVVLKEVTTQFTQAMQSIVRRANTDILPLIGNCIEAANTAINDVREDFIAPVRVKPVKADELLRSPELELVLKGFTERAEFNQSAAEVVYSYLVDLDKEQLKQLMLTNDPKLDGIVASKVDAEESNWTLFATDELRTLTSTPNQRHQTMMSPVKALTFLACSGILAGNLGDPSLELRKAALATMRFAEFGLRLQIDDAVKYIEDGVLLLGWDHDNYYVEERNYRNWLNQGGSIEAVMGYAGLCSRTRQRPSDADLRSQKPEQLMAEYERFLNTNKLTQGSLQSRAATTAVAAAIKAELERLKIEGRQTALADIMKRRPFTADKQLDAYACDVVMEVFELEQTQVGRFIRTKIEVSRALPDAEPKDITAAAVMRLLAWALATQIEQDECNEKRSNTVTLSSYY